VAVDLTPYEREKAFTAIRECREQIRQGTTALWLNAAYAGARGATLAQIAEATGFSADVVKRELRRVRGRG
jgi:AcrR family transcriptional regulator